MEVKDTGRKASDRQMWGRVTAGVETHCLGVFVQRPCRLIE